MFDAAYWRQLTITKAHAHIREELMRCGLLAVSDRADGCINKTTALRIRAIAHQACWPEDAPGDDVSGEMLPPPHDGTDELDGG